MARLRSNDGWQPLQEKHKRNILGTASHGTRRFLELTRNISHNFFEEIEGRDSKKLSQEFSRTESRILGAMSKLDEFPLNPQIATHSGTVPGTFRNTNVENQETNEDDSQSDPNTEAGIFCGQTTQNSGPKDCRDSTLYRRFIFKISGSLVFSEAFSGHCR